MKLIGTSTIIRVIDISKFCPNCGSPIREDTQYCENCGQQLTLQTQSPYKPPEPSYQPPEPAYQKPQQPGDVHVHLHNSNMEVSPKSKTAVILLWFFLGCFGIHHFYAERIGLGILYLCTYGLFGIGWCIDIIVILTDSYKDGQGRIITKG